MRALFLSMLCVGFSVPFSAIAAGSHCIVRDLGLPLAGEGVVDCGIADAGKPAQRRRAVACARKAIARKQPVRFGTGIMGIDAFECDVVVRDREGRFWKIEFGWDLSVFDDDKPKAFVGRCPTIDLDWKDPSGRGRFGPDECVNDPDAFERAKIRHP